MVTDHASLTWLRNFREPEGMVARWIACLQPFDFTIVHRPGKHHSHADGLSQRTSKPCKRETCPECKPLRKKATSKTEMARCYTPAFPYQCHFDGYVEMSEEDAALFWEIGNHLAPDPGGSSVGQALPDRAIPITEEAAPETTISPRPVPSGRPDDPPFTDVCTRPTSDSRDTKPAGPARLAHVQERAGALSHSPLITRPSHLQAIVGTQTDKTTQPRIETLEGNETPAILKETVIPGPMQPESNRTQREGRRRADIETPDRLELEFDNLWATLPFAEATWRPTYRVRAVTSADDVDRRVQEVLDLPVLNLAVMQGEDPDLVFIKELLRDHVVRPPWNAVREESAEVKILWTQFIRLKVQENVLYCRRKEAAADLRWQMMAPKPLRSQIFKACHHHAMAAHQEVVRTAALIKRRFYWPRMQNDVEAWCKRCTTCCYVTRENIHNRATRNIVNRFIYQKPKQILD